MLKQFNNKELLMPPEKIRELKEKRKTLQRELHEIEGTAIPEKRINDQGHEVTFVPLGHEKLKRMGGSQKQDRADQ